ncbi:altered inheritance of mitochondria protein 19 [Cristinia sonorae]|uniref:Altered inheritance of mitochondria protein 19 n=1 Tax=Cristinia sonorae TaxID=1940300 RepID=A0A8K0UHJ2_9AGAR|nr:altered inheritance of mitochondria protein 19 [Cristinia sonorae]
MMSSTSIATSPWPVWGVSALFLASAVLPAARTPAHPPIILRLGFGAIFAGAGYVLHAGDARNGSGISTAWSLTYLLLNARKALRRPFAAGPLALTGATVFSSALYGAEYFLVQDKDERDPPSSTS